MCWTLDILRWTRRRTNRRPGEVISRALFHLMRVSSLIAKSLFLMAAFNSSMILRKIRTSLRIEHTQLSHAWASTPPK
jgi:hypothetical protein